MRINTREINGTLLVDLTGRFPRDDVGINQVCDQFRDAIGGREDFVLILHDIGIVESTELGLLMKFLGCAGVENCGLGGASVRIVTGDRRLRDIFTVVDSPIIAFATEEEALSLGLS